VLWRRHAYQFTVMRLVAEHPVPVTRAAVATTLTTTPLRYDEIMIQP